MRIPIWPGVRLSVWEPQTPEAVKVTMSCYYKPFPFTVRRVLSKRGWMLLLVRYDWRDTGVYEPPDPAQSQVVRDLVLEVHRRATHLATNSGGFAEERRHNVAGEVLGLRGALGIALGGHVKGGEADRLGHEFYRTWVSEHASEWNRCRCDLCLTALEFTGGAR